VLDVIETRAFESGLVLMSHRLKPIA